MTATNDLRKLLELAAKAAGFELRFSDSGKDCWIIEDGESVKHWAPQCNDGDALRLETTLKFTAVWEPMRGGWSIGGIVAGEFKWLAFHEDRKHATTMAAAAIGEAMP